MVTAARQRSREAVASAASKAIEPINSSKRKITKKIIIDPSLSPKKQEKKKLLPQKNEKKLSSDTKKRSYTKRRDSKVDSDLPKKKYNIILIFIDWCQFIYLVDLD